MYIQTIIDDILTEIRHSDEAMTCNKEIAQYFSEHGYQVRECSTGFLHWYIK
jgi:hypothetical protein